MVLNSGKLEQYHGWWCHGMFFHSPSFFIRLRDSHMPLKHGPVRYKIRYITVVIKVKYSSLFWTHKIHPISRPHGRAMGCLCECLGGNLPYYNGTVRYSICRVIFSVGTNCACVCLPDTGRWCSSSLQKAWPRDAISYHCCKSCRRPCSLKAANNSSADYTNIPSICIKAMKISENLRQLQDKISIPVMLTDCGWYRDYINNNKTTTTTTTQKQKLSQEVYRHPFLQHTYSRCPITA